MKTLEERFWAKVSKTETCWNWTGCTNDSGYGKIWAEQTMKRAHRISYEIHHGFIPEGAVIDHRCHNLLCVNPGHLRAVTPRQNQENRAGANTGSKSGVRGVTWHKASQKWRAVVRADNRNVYDRHFDSLEDAAAAVIAARLQYMTHNDLDRVSA